MHTRRVAVIEASALWIEVQASGEGPLPVVAGRPESVAITGSASSADANNNRYVAGAALALWTDGSPAASVAPPLLSSDWPVNGPTGLSSGVRSRARALASHLSQS